ncbi:MAG: hypothetical protein FWB80_08145 [Defluviitaleaceae bacterium]|nr:hypothetical protein [Defluviitaleaceae bacterium]
MKELILQNKKLIIAVVVIAALLLINAIATNITIYAYDVEMEAPIPELHTTQLGISPEWIARIAIHELRINQLLYRTPIINQILQLPEFGHFQSIHNEKIEFLELALSQRYLVAEADITNLIESMISLHEFLLLSTQNGMMDVAQAQLSYRHWLLATTALQAGLMIALIFSSQWGSKQ